MCIHEASSAICRDKNLFHASLIRNGLKHGDFFQDRFFKSVVAECKYNNEESKHFLLQPSKYVSPGVNVDKTKYINKTRKQN
jgi:hypothetical protein